MRTYKKHGWGGSPEGYPCGESLLLAANVYPQDELRGGHKAELSPLKESHLQEG